MELIVIQYCAVYDCYNTNETRPELTFFNISKEDSDKEVKFMEWSRYINPKHCKESSFVICEEHFNDDMVGVDGKQKILMPNAFPVRQLGHTKPQQESTSIVPTPGPTQPMGVPKEQTRILTVSPMTSMNSLAPGRLIPVKLVPSPLPPLRLLPGIHILSNANEFLQNETAGSSHQISTAAKNPHKRKALEPEDSGSAALHSEETIGSTSGSAQSTESLETGATRSISVQTMKPRVSAHHDYSSLCDRYLKGNLAQIVKIQAKAGGIVTEDLKSFYKELYTTSAEAYQFLQPVLSLPDPDTLRLELETRATVELVEADVFEIVPSTSKK